MNKLLIITLITPLFSYLDPGTGSMLLYFFMGILATIFFSIKEFFYKIGNFFIFLKGGKVKVKDDLDIVFYSEGGKYWNVFKPILRHLKNTNIKCGYFTSDELDEGLKYNYPNIDTKYLGNELFSIFVLNNLKAKIVVMTTPQLDVLGLKRSKNVQYYCHLIHAPTDALTYKKFAFDYFDCIMCSGSHQIKSIRALEKKRNLKPKNLLKTGLTYYDISYEEKSKYIKDDKKNIVLVAPTWGNNGMIHKYGDKILIALLENKMNVIFRPHPQLYIDTPQKMDLIENTLSKYPNCEIDKSSSGDKSMAMSDILISDVSGIIFDFAFIYQKAIIVLGGKIDVGGLEAEDVDHEVWESSIFNKLARVIKDDEIDYISQIVKQELSSNSIEDLEKIKNDSLFNFAKAGKVGASQLENLLLNLKPTINDI